MKSSNSGGLNSSTVLPFPRYYSYYPFPKYYGCSANGRNKVIKCITFFFFRFEFEALIRFS